MMNGLISRLNLKRWEKSLIMLLVYVKSHTYGHVDRQQVSIWRRPAHGTRIESRERRAYNQAQLFRCIDVAHV